MPRPGGGERRLAGAFAACRGRASSCSWSPGGRILSPKRLPQSQRDPGFAALFVGVLLERFS